MPATVQPGPGSEEFALLADQFRPELLAHCYRMLGSVQDAEDQAQETLLRAWRSYGSFEGRSSLRTWLYRIATNACLRAMENRERRPLPSGLGAPGDDPAGPVAPPASEVSWLDSFPDALLRPESADPATVAAARSGLRLARLCAELRGLSVGCVEIVQQGAAYGFSQHLENSLDGACACQRSWSMKV